MARDVGDVVSAGFGIGCLLLILGAGACVVALLWRLAMWVGG